MRLVCSVKGCLRARSEYKRYCGAHLNATSDDEEVVDAVSSPVHYTRFPGIEVIQLTRHLNFNRGNAIKYLARAGTKITRPDDGKTNPLLESEREDVKKALWYIADECQRLGVDAAEIQKIVEKHK